MSKLYDPVFRGKDMLDIVKILISYKDLKSLNALYFLFPHNVTVYASWYYLKVYIGECIALNIPYRKPPSYEVYNLVIEVTNLLEDSKNLSNIKSLHNQIVHIDKSLNKLNLRMVQNIYEVLAFTKRYFKYLIDTQYYKSELDYDLIHILPNLWSSFEKKNYKYKVILNNFKLLLKLYPSFRRYFYETT